MKLAPRVAHVYLRLFREGLKQSWLGVAAAIGCSFLSIAIIGAVFVAIGQGVGYFADTGDIGVSNEGTGVAFSTLLYVCLGIAGAIMAADALAYLARRIARHVGRLVSVNKAQKVFDGIANGTCESLTVFTDVRELTTTLNRSLRLSGIAIETMVSIIEAGIGIIIFGVMVFDADPWTGLIACIGSLLTIPAIWGLQKKIRDTAVKYYGESGIQGRGSISRLVRDIDGGSQPARRSDGSVEIPEAYARDMLDDFDSVKLASARTRFASSLLQAVVLFAVMLSLAWQISRGALDMAHATVAVLALLKLSQTCKSLAGTGAVLSRYFSMLGPFDMLLTQLQQPTTPPDTCQLHSIPTAAGFTPVSSGNYALDSETPVGKIATSSLGRTIQSGFSQPPALGMQVTVSRRTQADELDSLLNGADCIFASMHVHRDVRACIEDKADAFVFWCSEGQEFDRSNFEHVLVIDDKGKAEWDSDFRRETSPAAGVDLDDLDELDDDD